MFATSRTTAVAAVALFALAGCTGGSPGDPEPDPEVVDDVATTPADCFTGGPWQLDLADYAAQAEPWMVGLGIPISDFAMSGSQTVQFTTDGLMSVTTDLVSTGVLHTPDGDVPISVPSNLGGSGDWALDDGGRMTIENWSSDGAVPEDTGDDSVQSPLIDYSTIDSVGVTCQPGLLSLTAPDSPFVPLFHR